MWVTFPGWPPPPPPPPPPSPGLVLGGTGTGTWVQGPRVHLISGVCPRRPLGVSWGPEPWTEPPNVPWGEFVSAVLYRSPGLWDITGGHSAASVRPLRLVHSSGSQPLGRRARTVPRAPCPVHDPPLPYCGTDCPLDSADALTFWLLNSHFPLLSTSQGAGRDFTARQGGGFRGPAPPVPEGGRHAQRATGPRGRHSA